ncbi:MAG: TonB-dependent receptor [Bacteroidetes bacterium]|nr:MAG: TonB-dependent receptor [Bacteroidota bacterium]
MKQIIAITALLLASFSLMAQNRVVYGKLTVYNTFPIKNVEVTSKKAKAATTSDSLGYFAIVCQVKDVIQIKPKAFQSVNKSVKGETDTLRINLIFINSKKNREIAVGYGYLSEEDLNYAVSHLEAENNNFCSYTNIFDLIRGQFSGVTVTDNAVFIRGGNTSFTPGASAALFVVNGQPTTGVDWISPCEIATIDILKGSDAAIYGTRGGNGVILITTRKE